MNDREVVYEVNLLVERAIANEYLPWLHAHVAQMLVLPGFLDAILYAIDQDAVADDDHVGWCVHYRLRDRAALETYLRDHAPQMRTEGVARFGTRFGAQRRILRVLDLA